MTTPSRRRVFQILGYIVATLFVVAGTALLIAYGNGYSYDFTTGRLVHRGLLIIQTTPSGADVSLDGKLLKQRTTYRQTFAAGTYPFQLIKSGFHSWHKTLRVVPSQVSLIDYVILIPNSIPQQTVSSFVAIAQITQSRDHSRIAVVGQSGAQPGIWSLDTGNNHLTHIYAPAAATPTAPAEAVQVLSWSDDNSHVLLHSQIGDKSSLIVAAANGTDQPINITDTLQIDATELRFDPSNWRQLYWQSPEGLRRVDLGNQTVSPPLADHVAAYTFASGRLVYVDTAKAPASLWQVNGDGSGKQRLIAKLPASKSYAIDYGSYLGTAMVAVAAPDAGSVMLYSNIFDSPTAKRLNVMADHLTFSSAGRFLLLSGGSQTYTYDLQQPNLASMTAPIDAASVNWFDENHLEYNQAGKAYLSEFDHNYAIALTGDAGLVPQSSADGKTMYVTTAGKAADGTPRVDLKALRLIK